jgi:hypothetical protein
LNQKYQNGPTWPTTHYIVFPLSLLAEQRSVTQKSPEQLEKPVGLRQKSADSADKSAQTRRRADLQGGGRILSENRWLFGKMQRFLIFSYDFSMVLSLNVDDMLRYIDYSLIRRPMYDFN